MQDFEKLGAFYLGKTFDFERGLQDDLLLYDSKDLTTHAVCVGMTGSGKTGLCLSLLEEAAIDGIPVIAIDPKGDLGNLLLTFPELRGEDFREWIDEGAAARAGLSPDAFAARTAEKWRSGLAEWGQGPERIARLRDAADMAIYTPGSSAGLPLTVLRSFDAPPPEVIDDSDAFRSRVSSATSGLLALLGIDADPVQSREHILISNLFDTAWRKGQGLDIAGLIEQIQSPPFAKVGVFELDKFFPPKDRLALSMTLNNLLASPSFSSWLEGEPLDIKRLLHTVEGKPRISVISIAHMSDAERMFFVTILLNEVLAWVRAQPGTGSLRALLYMDEVYGYFPPVAQPPSKAPMLTLLKQARAFGLGIVLATQNPVDLDYKGLSNAGTWFLGRLQTERDKARVLEGLEGASLQAGATFNRQQMEATLAGLGNRVFLMNNVHEDAPVVFQTRWALSYLRGPLTRGQIQKLMAPRKRAASELDAASPAAPGAVPKLQQQEPPAAAPAEDRGVASGPASVPEGVPQRFLLADELPRGEQRLVYRPALLGQARLHFVRASYEIDTWISRAMLAPVGERLPDPLWAEAHPIDVASCVWADEAEEGAEFAPLGPDLTEKRSFASFLRQLKDHLYQNETLTVWQCAALKKVSRAGEDQADFRVRLTMAAHEERDRAVESVRAKYRARLEKQRDRIDSAQDRLAREQAEYDGAKMDTAVSLGSTILGALFGRKVGRRSTTTARGAARAAKQRSDVTRAEDRLRDEEADFALVEADLYDEIAAIEKAYQPDRLEFEEQSLRTRKRDIDASEVELVWLPWIVAEGVERPAWN